MHAAVESTTLDAIPAQHRRTTPSLGLSLGVPRHNRNHFTYETCCKYITVLRMYLDVAYHYRLSSMVCRSVTLVSPAKTAAPIEMLFRLRTWVDPRNHVLNGGLDPPWKGAILRGKGASY